MSMKAQLLLSHAFAVVLTTTVLSGCATSQSTASTQTEPKPEAKLESGTSSAASASAATAATAPTEHFFIVYHENGRIYPIADAKNYLSFLDTDELTYTRTRIGAGPEGETIVFGIEKEEAGDLKKPAKAESFFDGKYEPAGPFYGEIVRDGRIHVFGSWRDFKDYLVNNEITYTYTEIGVGPKGETVIYALNKNTVKEGRPVKLIEAFNKLRK